MKAKRSTRFNPEDRTYLPDAIPLSTPLLVFVDPAGRCNFKCKFCPCGRMNPNDGKKGILSYETYRKIIDDLKQFPDKIKTLRLYKEGEPLLNKRLPDMIQYARRCDVAQNIDFTTNGSLLTRDLNLALIDAGLSRIVISVEALSEEGYREISGAKIDFEGFCATIAHLYEHRKGCQVCIKTTDWGLQGQDPQRFFDLFEIMCDEIYLEHITPVWPEHSPLPKKTDFSVGIYGNTVRKTQVCPYLFYSICVNSDETVSACLMDWQHKLIVGNAATESLVDIWDGTRMQELRKQHLEEKRESMAVCGQCGQLDFAAMDNIDAHRETLLKRLFD